MGVSSVVCVGFPRVWRGGSCVWGYWGDTAVIILLDLLFSWGIFMQADVEGGGYRAVVLSSCCFICLNHCWGCRWPVQYIYIGGRGFLAYYLLLYLFSRCLNFGAPGYFAVVRIFCFIGCASFPFCLVLYGFCIIQILLSALPIPSVPQVKSGLPCSR